MNLGEASDEWGYKPPVSLYRRIRVFVLCHVLGHRWRMRFTGEKWMYDCARYPCEAVRPYRD